MGELGRQDGLLDLLGNVEFVLESDELIARGQGLAPFHHMSQSAFYGDPEVLKVDGFCDEVKSAAVHRRADVLHVAVGGNHDGAGFWGQRGGFVPGG